MTWNILAYSIYLSLTILTIVIIGRQLHSNGIFYVRKVLPEETTADTVNNILLLAYYLVNIGYSFLTLSNWEPITDVTMLLKALCEHLGFIYLLLALLHYNNILCLRLYAEWRQIDLFNTKNTSNGK